MAQTTLSRTYGDVLSMTLDTEFESGKLHDLIFNGFPMMTELRGKVKKKSGGAKIGVGIINAKNSTAGSYRDLDVLNTKRQQFATKAWLDWKQAAVTVSISGLEMKINNGPEEVLDLYDERIDHAIMSLDDAMNVMFWADGSGNDFKDLLGMRAWVPDNPATGTIGGINRATETYYRSKQRGSGSFAAQGISDLRALRVSCSNNVPRGQPTVHFTTPDIYNSYEAIMEPRERFVRDYRATKGAIQSGDVGFVDGSLTFQNAPIRYDDACPSGRWYMCNGNFWNLVVHTEADFRPTDRIQMHDQDAWVVHILFMGEFIISAPRFFGVLTSITP